MIKCMSSIVVYWFSSFFQSAFFWLLSIYTARTFGAVALGELNYVLALISPLMIIAGLQLRNYCLTQHQEEPWKRAKFYRLLLPTLVLVGMGLYVSQWHHVMLGTFIFLAVIKWCESWSDLCFGWLQNQDNLFKLSWLQSFKYGLPSLLILISLMIRPAVDFQTALGIFSGLFIISTIGDHVMSGWQKVRSHPQWDSAMLKSTGHLALASFVTTLSVNVPRYFLEHKFSLVELAHFSALFYFYAIPQLVFNYLNLSLLKRLKDVLTMKRFLILTGLMLIGSVAFYVILDNLGSTLLELLYSLSIPWQGSYALSLTALMFLSSFLSFLYYYLMSAQVYHLQLTANITSLTVTGVMSWWLIPSHGVEGALWALVAGNTVLAMIYLKAFLSHKYA